MPDIIFNGGDEVRQPFRVSAQDLPVDLTGCQVKVIIATRAKTIELTVNNGVTITRYDPTSEEAHGEFILTEEQTKSLSPNYPITARIVVINPQDITMSTQTVKLIRKT